MQSNNYTKDLEVLKKAHFLKKEVALYPKQKRSLQSKRIKNDDSLSSCLKFKEKNWTFMAIKLQGGVKRFLYTSQGPAGTVGVFQCRTQVYNSFMIQWHLLMWLNVWCKMFFFFARKPTGKSEILVIFVFLRFIAIILQGVITDYFKWQVDRW